MPADPCPTCAGVGYVLGDPPASVAWVGVGVVAQLHDASDPCPTCAGVGELEGGRGEPPRVDCPTCSWRLSDRTKHGLGRALIVAHPHTVVTWWPSGYVVTGPDGPNFTRASIATADLPTVLAAHGCRMPSDAALAWLRGESLTPTEAT